VKLDKASYYIVIIKVSITIINHIYYGFENGLIYPHTIKTSLSLVTIKIWKS